MFLATVYRKIDHYDLVIQLVSYSLSVICMFRSTVNFLRRVGLRNPNMSRVTSNRRRKWKNSAETSRIGHVIGDFSGALIFAK